MSTTNCARRVLAAGDFAVIEQCSCGAIHMTIGAVTLRLASGAIAPLAATLNDAVRGLVLDEALSTTSSRREVLS